MKNEKLSKEWGLNQRPLGRESLALTTRPRVSSFQLKLNLSPNKATFSKTFYHFYLSPDSKPLSCAIPMCVFSSWKILNGLILNKKNTFSQISQLNFSWLSMIQFLWKLFQFLVTFKITKNRNDWCVFKSP